MENHHHSPDVKGVNNSGVIESNDQEGIEKQNTPQQVELTMEQKQSLRQYSLDYMKALHDEVNNMITHNDIQIPYWLDGRNSINGQLNQRSMIHKDINVNNIFFNYNGFIKKSEFCTKRECDDMIQQMELLIHNDWNEHETLDTFGTNEKENIIRDRYFLESSNQVHYFTEPHAVTQIIINDIENKINNSEEDTTNEKHVEGKKEALKTITTTTTKMILKPEYSGSKKSEALNKVGHALHLYPYWQLNELKNYQKNNKIDIVVPIYDDNKQVDNKEQIPNVFYQYCTSNKIQSLLINELQYIDPVVPQSMYIFKQSYHGGIVNSHQDSTFLYTTPKQTCIGLWLALHDSTLNNGCLWIRPKSHINESTRRHYQQNNKIIINDSNNNNDYHNDEPKFIMKELYDYHETVPWDGGLPTFIQAQRYKQRKQEQQQQQQLSSTALPFPSPPVIVPINLRNDDDNNNNKLQMIQNLLDCDFIPIECNHGDLLVFCGDIDHLSLYNDSSLPRHTFQLHIVEGPNANIIWSPSNWLQYPNHLSFLRLK